MQGFLQIVMVTKEASLMFFQVLSFVSIFLMNILLHGYYIMPILISTDE